MSYTATYTLTSPFSGSITVTVGTTQQTDGGYLITAASGNVNGVSITGISFSNFEEYPAGPNVLDGLNDGFNSQTGNYYQYYFQVNLANGSNFQIVNSNGTLYYNMGSASGQLTASFSTNVPCFAQGTRIATAAGEAAVETLAIGDLVRTRAGRLRAVRWIGRRRYLRDPLADAIWAEVAPIRITRDAIAPGLPARDLCVSPDHSLFLDGQLVPAKLLLNGTTIARDLGGHSVAYVHIELGGHDVVLAEGLPAETYLDDGNRALFDNDSEAPPAASGAPAAWYAPRMTEGEPALTALRERLDLRAHLLGAGVVSLNRAA